MKSIDLEFQGPFAWYDADDAPFIRSVEIAENPGVYL